ncbi:MAG: flagellar basal body P-ring formation chaperone FlgA, partial [Pseudomonadota bacterium]
AAAPPTGDGAIAFHERAEVLGDEMTLGDLAELSGPWAALADVSMGRAPEPGKTLVLGRLELLGKLSATVPRGTARVTCPDKVLVARCFQSVTRAQVLRALTDALEARLGAKDSEVLVSGLKMAEEPLVPKGDLALAVDLPEADERLLGNLNLTLQIKTNGVVARKLRISAAVALKAAVVCAARQLRRHEVLRPEDVVVSLREVSALEPLRDAGQVVGRWAGHGIEAGEIIGRRDLEDPQIISRGAAVAIVLVSGAMTITTQGIAQEGGRAGDVVRVLNTDSKREVPAQVVDSATVRVSMER